MSSHVPIVSSNFAYHLGDYGPGGGIVFALPWTGPNQSSWYYEITVIDTGPGSPNEYQQDFTYNCTGSSCSTWGSAITPSPIAGKMKDPSLAASVGYPIQTGHGLK